MLLHDDHSVSMYGLLRFLLEASKQQIDRLLRPTATSYIRRFARRTRSFDPLTVLASLVLRRLSSSFAVAYQSERNRRKAG